MAATVTGDELTRQYLRRLRHLARMLPRRERAELLAQIEEHLREAVPPGASEAELRTILDRLGDPEEIVAEEVERLELPDRHAGGAEILTVVLLLMGGFLFVLGWVVGAVLLWSSRAWTVREKLLGTLLVPGGLAASVYLVLLFGISTTSCDGLGRRRVCVGEPSTAHDILLIVLFGALVLAPIATSVVLLRRARARPRRALALH
jgi:hypothetical protein